MLAAHCQSLPKIPAVPTFVAAATYVWKRIEACPLCVCFCSCCGVEALECVAKRALLRSAILDLTINAFFFKIALSVFSLRSP